MKPVLRNAVVIATGLALAALVIALPKHISQTISFVLALVVFEEVYRWHRREIRAGRRDPVWFGKHRREQTP